MGGQPWIADWEHVIGSDLVPHLISAGQARGAYRPSAVAWLPAGAHAALSSGVGCADPDDMLVLPAAAWRFRGWRRRSLYTPLSVAAIGEQEAALWVQALPVPAVRVRVPFSDIAAIERRAEGPGRALIVTGTAGRLIVRYREDGDKVVDGWLRGLRRRAVPLAAPGPSAYPAGKDHGGELDADAFGLEHGEDLVSARWCSYPRGAACQLAVTSRELVIVESLPGRGLERTLYVPRRSVRGVTVQGPALSVQCGGTEVTVRLWSRKVVASMSSWLGETLIDRNRSDAGTGPAQPGGA